MHSAPERSSGVQSYAMASKLAQLRLSSLEQLISDPCTLPFRQYRHAAQMAFVRAGNIASNRADDLS